MAGHFDATGTPDPHPDDQHLVPTSNPDKPVDPRGGGQHRIDGHRATRLLQAARDYVDGVPMHTVLRGLHVGDSSVRQAATLIRHGDEELIADVEAGRVGISVALSRVRVATRAGRPAGVR